MSKWLLRTSRVVVAFALVCLTPTLAPAQDARGNFVPVPLSQVHPVVATGGMVVAQESRAARIGADVLAHGGNAIDAAVATGFAMAVTYPRAGNLGGGGFMVVHLADGRDVAIDYRESAPAATTRDVFLGVDGKPDPHKSRLTGLGIGVPGTVAGLTLALEKYGSGKFTLSDLLAPAIKLARDGMPIEDDVADTMGFAARLMGPWPSSKKIFFHLDGTPLHAGEMMVQTDLAATLQAISSRGPRAFYEGDIAEKIAAAVKDAGGLMTADDLKAYQPIIREVVHGTYRGYDIVSMPLPSSGGTVLIEMLNMLEHFDLKAMGADSVDTAHVLVEAMKRGYADRARYLGDPATVDVPLQRLLSKSYGDLLSKTIDLKHATPAADVATLAAQPREGQNTTHFSVIDKQGNAVSNTYSLNFPYGIGLVADGTGVLLNNTLDDFTAAVGASNFYGLVGFEANLPGPNKRPLSSMTPTIVLKDGKPWLVTGTPGGSYIISATMQVILNVIDHGMNVAAAVAKPRLHDQWLPDEVRVEHGFPADVAEGLRARGDKVIEPLGQTSANSILVTDEGFAGAADPRTRGALAVGF
jgi:gamma-glutamyltranspeptidase / glutathione hydrolase